MNLIDMNTTLVFCPTSSGHYYEYTKHIFEESFKIRKKVIFLIPKKIANKLESSEVIIPKHIEIKFLGIEDEKKINSKNIFLKSFFISKILKRELNHSSVSNIFTLSIMSTLPLIPIYLYNYNVRISGIIYLIYLHRWKNSSGTQKILDVIKYTILTRSRLFRNIYILNDEFSADFLNKVYKTKKFKFLVDPINLLDSYSGKDFREKEGINKKVMVISHFGYLEERKGTIEILKAIIETDTINLNNKAFVFAGQINDNIKDYFYSLLKTARKKAKIIVLEGWFNEATLTSICTSSNYLLIPYQNIHQSSGVLGYAAQFKIPVIGPKKGLLGKKIKKYKLGLTLDDISYVGISRCIKDIVEFTGDNEFLLYQKENSVEKFKSTILCNI